MIKIKNRTVYASTNLKFKIPVRVNEKTFYFVYFFREVLRSNALQMYVLFSDDKGNAYVNNLPLFEFVALKDDVSNESFANHIEDTFYKQFFTYIHKAMESHIDDAVSSMHYHGNFAVIQGFNDIPTHINMKEVMNRVFANVSLPIESIDKEKLFSFLEVNVASLHRFINQETDERIKKNVVKYYKKLKAFYRSTLPLTDNEVKRLENLTLPYGRFKSNLWTHAYRKKIVDKIIDVYVQKTGKFYIPYGVMVDKRYLEVDRRTTLYLSYLLHLYSLASLNRFISKYYVNRYGKERTVSIGEEERSKQLKNIFRSKGKLVGYHVYDKYFDTVRVVPAEDLKIYDKKENLYTVKDYSIAESKVEVSLRRKKEFIIDGSTLVTYKTFVPATSMSI